MRRFVEAGQNPPTAAIVTYYLASAPSNPSSSFKDAQGNVIREVSSLVARGAREWEAEASLRAPANAGWNRFVWAPALPQHAEVQGTDPISETVYPGLGRRTRASTRSR
ncbi:MAG: hypothetical protein U0822_18495 [Anaerolineae bacterium]